MLLSECHFVAPFLPRLFISLTTEIARADDYGGTVANRKARPLAGLSLNVPLRRDPVLGRDAVCGTGCPWRKIKYERSDDAGRRGASPWHPTAEWIAQQVEAIGWEKPPKYLLCDRDQEYGDACGLHHF
jgi:hypothetical protein